MSGATPRVANGVRTVTGTIDVGTTAVSAGPGVSRGSASDFSTTTVTSRATPTLREFRLTGSTRTSRGPKAARTVRSAGKPVTRLFGRSVTRPAQASG